MKLKKAIQVLNKIPKTSLSVVQDNYLIDAEYISATDLDLTIKIKVDEFEFNKIKRVIVNKKAIQKASNLKKIDVFRFNEKHLDIIGSVNVKVPYFQDIETDYPIIELIEESIGTFKVPSCDISWYTSKDVDRQSLCCVKIESDRKRFIATDGHVLKFQSSVDVNLEFDMLVHHVPFSLLQKNEVYNCFKNKKKLAIEKDDITFLFNEVSSPYPDVDKCVKDLRNTIDVDLNELKTVIKDILPFTTKSKLIRFSSVENSYASFNKLNISCINRDNNVEVNKELIFPNGELVDERGFNGELMLKILNDISDESKFYVNNEPIYTGQKTGLHYFKDSNSLTGIMPLRIFDDIK